MRVALRPTHLYFGAFGGGRGGPNPNNKQREKSKEQRAESYTSSCSSRHLPARACACLPARGGWRWQPPRAGIAPPPHGTTPACMSRLAAPLCAATAAPAARLPPSLRLINASNALAGCVVHALTCMTCAGPSTSTPKARLQRIVRRHDRPAFTICLPQRLPAAHAACQCGPSPCFDLLA